MAVSNAKPSSLLVKDPPRPGRFDVLIVYEDFAAGVGARRCLQNVLEQLRLDAEHHLTLWRLDLLNERPLSAQAISEAAGADVVLLSLHGDRALPAAAKQWLVAWLGQRDDRGGALGVLFDREKQHTPAGQETLTYLRRVTRRRSVDFFAGYFRAPNSSAASIPDEIRQWNGSAKSTAPRITTVT